MTGSWSPSHNERSIRLPERSEGPKPHNETVGQRSPSAARVLRCARNDESLVVVLLAVTFFLAVALRQVHRPVIYDEADFARAAQALAATGSFRYDRGYIADYPWNAESGGREQLALYHPPGYVIALAGWLRVAAPPLSAWSPADPLAPDAALRAFGVLCGLGTLAATVALAAIAAGRAAAGWAAVLWATSPYTIQGALLLDIDGTLLPSAVAGFVALSLIRGAGRARRAARAGLFAVCLWLKLTTPVTVAGLLVLWLVAAGRVGAARAACGAAAAGTALFVASWLAFAAAAGLPSARPFQDTAYELTDTLAVLAAPHGHEAPAGQTASGETADPVAADPAPAGFALRVLVAGIRSAQWLHPLFVGLLLAAPLAFRRRDPAAGLLCMAAVIMVLYLGKMAAGFPKYHVGVLPLASAALGVAASGWLAGAHRWTRTLLAAAAAAGALATVLFGADALIRRADLGLLTGWLLAGAACLAAARPLGAGRAAAVAIGLLLGANAATAVHQSGYAPSATYFYGATGQREAGAWLRSTLTPGELVVADREVAYYAQPVQFVDTERLLFPDTGGGVAATPAHGARYVVTRHELGRRLPAAAELVVTFGDYRVWRVN
jgi:hypothetical protein